MIQQIFHFSLVRNKGFISVFQNQLIRMSSNKRALENDDPINVTTSVCSNVNEDIIIENQNKKRVRLEDSSLNVSDYYIENGLRKVYPYIYTYNSYCKGRWVGSKLSELFEKEFRPVGEEVIVCILIQSKFLFFNFCFFLIEYAMQKWIIESQWGACRCKLYAERQ